MPTTLDILDKLVSFDTVSSKSNLALIDYIESFLAERRFELTKVSDPTGTKAGVFAKIGPDGPGLLLSAHTDVVPVAGQDWSRDPFRLTLENDRLYGRGTTDMKGFLASMLSLADRASRETLCEPLKLSISYDEEVGCLGMAHMIDTLPKVLGHPRGAIVGEPTEMGVVTGHKGKVGLKGTARGQAGHSSLAPRFENALHVAADFMSGLRALQEWYAANGHQDAQYDIPYSTFHVGILSGGTALNIVPDRAELIFEFRHLAEDDPEAIFARIQKLAGRTIDLEQISAYPGLATDPDADIVRKASAWAATNQVSKVAYGTEAGFFDRLDIPTIVCGPGSMEGQGHKPDEYIERSQLALCDAMLERILSDLRA